MKNNIHNSIISKTCLVFKLSLMAFLITLTLSSQTVDKGGALGHASSALTTMDFIYYKDLKANWATTIKISRSFDKFMVDFQAPSAGKLYLITTPDDLGLSNASQIKHFVGSASTKKGYKTLEVINNTPTGKSTSITIDKDNSGDKIKALNDSISMDFRVYMAYENAKGFLEKGFIYEPISLLQEFEEVELSSPLKPQYAYKIGYPIEYFDSNNNKKFPIIVNLHGAGGGKEGAAGMGGFKSPRQHGYSSIVISPASGGGSWDSTKMNDFVEYLKTTYSKIIDEKRIYFMGFSMGGRGVWDMSMAHGDKIAAAVVNAGGFRGYTDVSHMDFSKVIDLPFWAFHNCDDSVAEISIGWAPINALVTAGGKPKYLINIAPNPDFPSLDKHNKNPNLFAADYRNLEGSRKGHKLNGNHFYNDEFYKWLFSQTR